MDSPSEFVSTNDSIQQDRLQVLIAAYRAVFEQPAQAEHVLTDLAEFCYAAKSTFSTDPLEIARREGRREVLMRILDFSALDYRALANLYLKSSWSL